MSGGEARDLYTLMNHVVSFHVLEVQKTHAEGCPHRRFAKHRYADLEELARTGFRVLRCEMSQAHIPCKLFNLHVKFIKALIVLESNAATAVHRKPGTPFAGRMINAPAGLFR